MIVKLCTCRLKCCTISMLQATWKVLNLVASAVHLKTVYFLKESKFQLRFMQINNASSESECTLPWFLLIHLLPAALCSPNRLFVCLCLLFLSVCVFFCLFACLFPCFIASLLAFSFGLLGTWTAETPDNVIHITTIFRCVPKVPSLIKIRGAVSEMREIDSQHYAL
jgi:hypothetical protein